MNDIEITEEEYDLLKNAEWLSSELKERIVKIGNKYYIRIDEAEEKKGFIEPIGDQIPKHFNRDYTATPTGNLLEDLMTKLTKNSSSPSP